VHDWLLRSRDNSTVQMRGLFIFTLATALSEGCSMWTALCSQWRLALADAHRRQRQATQGGTPFSYHCRRTYEWNEM